MTDKTLTQSILKEYLKYDPDTGIFTRLICTNRVMKIGDIAGTSNFTGGYHRIQLLRHSYMAHDLAWLYVYGIYPTKTITHINEIKNDNRICNLRIKCAEVLTQITLREYFNYNYETGIFTRLINVCSRTKCGEVAGVLTKSGYIRMRFAGKKYLAHRLAWLYIYGVFPEKHLDHINGNRQDNRISNLRNANDPQNTQNARVRIDNGCGKKGVNLDIRHQKWVARCQVDKKRYFIGLFSTKEEASDAYEKFANIHHKEFYYKKNETNPSTN